MTQRLNGKKQETEKGNGAKYLQHFPKVTISGITLDQLVELFDVQQESHWLKKVARSNSSQDPFWMEFVCSGCACVGFLHGTQQQFPSTNLT